VPSALAKNCGSRRTRSFAASRKTADPRTEKCSLLVNLDKQPTVVHRPDGSTINFTYDSAGRVATVTYPKGAEVSDGTVTVTRTYNATTGKLASVSTSDGQTVTYGYDGSLVTSTTWSGTVAGSVGRTYNNDLRLASESVNGANSLAFGYDNDGLLTSADGLSVVRDPTNGLITDTTLGGVTDHRTYDSFGQVATYEAKFGTTSLYSVGYVRDALGRIEQKTETIQDTTTVWSYSYDSARRLWQVMKDGVLTATYLYDANGNRLSKSTPSGTEAATYDDQDRMLTYGKWTYTYTANGDLRTKTDATTADVTRYGYDGDGNLRRGDLPNGHVIEYLHDGLERRVGKKFDGALIKQLLYRDGLAVLAELDGAGSVVGRFAYAGTATSPDLITKGGTSYRVVSDQVGSVRVVVNVASGAVAERLDYDEFGSVLLDTNPGFQPFGFAGGLPDADMGLVRFGARDYDPATGRWTAKDPILFQGGDTDLYRYVLSDPVNKVDPTGLVLPLVCAAGYLAAEEAAAAAAAAAAGLMSTLAMSRPWNPADVPGTTTETIQCAPDFPICGTQQPNRGDLCATFCKAVFGWNRTAFVGCLLLCVNPFHTT